MYHVIFALIEVLWRVLWKYAKIIDFLEKEVIVTICNTVDCKWNSKR